LPGPGIASPADGARLNSVATLTGNPFQDKTTYTVRATAYDNAGNTDTNTRTFTYDVTLPAGSLTYGAADLSHVDQGDLIITATFNELLDTGTPPSLTVIGGGPLEAQATPMIINVFR